MSKRVSSEYLSDEEHDDEGMLIKKTSKKSKRHSTNNNTESNNNMEVDISDPSVSIDIKSENANNKIEQLLNIEKLTSNTLIHGFKKKSENSGTIKLIELTNFMNHARLVLNFGPKINVIHGKNGSGKSVFSAALQVALGSSAKETGRGGKLFDLVRRGQQKAVVKVVINNSGIDAYEPEVWGDEIEIVRTITDLGAPYEIRGNKSKYVLKKEVKKFLERMTDHFNIQVHNPVVMMTQDVCKQFLQSQDDSELYKLFLEATKLRNMKSLISETESQLHSWEHVLETATKLLVELKAKMKQADKEYSEVKLLERREDDLRTLKSRLVWATIIAAEKNLETIVGEIDKSQDEVTKFTDKLNKFKEQEKNLDDEYNILDEKNLKFLALKKSREAEVSKLEADLKITKKANVDAKHALNKEEKTIETLTIRLEGAKERKEEALKDFEEEQANNQSHNELLSLQKERDEKYKEIASLNERISCTTKDDGSNLVSLDSEIEDMKGNMEDLRRSIFRIKDDTNRAAASLKDSVSSFGAKATEVARDIDHTTWAGDKPIGPLGRFVELVDNKNCAEVEEVLKWSLDAYLVSNHTDVAKLTSILRRYYDNNSFLPNIYVEKVLPKFDINSEKFEYPTVLSKFRVTNNWAYNCLVNQTGPERIVLFPLREGIHYHEDHMKATRFLTQHFRDVKELITPTTAKLKYFNGSTAYNPNYIVNNFKSRLIGSSVNQINATIKSNTVEIKRLESDLTEHRRAIDDAVLRRQALAEEASNASNKLKLKLILIKEEKKLSAILRLISDNEKNTDKQFDSTQFDKEIYGIEDDLESHSKNLSTLEKNLLETEKKLEQANQLRSTSTSIFDNASFEENNNRLKEIVEDSEQIKSKIDELNAAINKKIKSLNVSQDNLNVLKNKLELLKSNKIAGERIEETSSVKNLESEIRKLETCIVNERNRVGDVDELLKNKLSAESAYNNLNSKVVMGHARLDQTFDATLLREKWWEEFRRAIAAEVHLAFCMNLEKRGHSADLKFDFDNNKIDLKVTMNATSSNAKSTNNIKMLSGGERSFTTLCFALALGDSLCTPFRLMDEFDVFMDSVNRRQALNLLVRTAIRNGGQYILMTPQDISGISLDDDEMRSNMRIHILKDPIRNQAVLNFDGNDNEQQDE